MSLSLYVSGVMGRSDRKVEASHPIRNLDLKTRMQIMAGGIQFLPPARRRLRDALVHHAIASLQRLPFGNLYLAAGPAGSYDDSPKWDSVTTTPPAGAQPEPQEV